MAEAKSGPWPDASLLRLPKLKSYLQQNQIKFDRNTPELELIDIYNHHKKLWERQAGNNSGTAEPAHKRKRSDSPLLTSQHAPPVRQKRARKLVANPKWPAAGRHNIKKLQEILKEHNIPFADKDGPAVLVPLYDKLKLEQQNLNTSASGAGAQQPGGTDTAGNLDANRPQSNQLQEVIPAATPPPPEHHDLDVADIESAHRRPEINRAQEPIPNLAAPPSPTDAPTAEASKADAHSDHRAETNRLQEVSPPAAPPSPQNPLDASDRRPQSDRAKEANPLPAAPPSPQPPVDGTEAHSYHQAETNRPQQVSPPAAPPSPQHPTDASDTASDHQAQTDWAEEENPIAAPPSPQPPPDGTEASKAEALSDHRAETNRPREVIPTPALPPSPQHPSDAADTTKADPCSDRRPVTKRPEDEIPSPAAPSLPQDHLDVADTPADCQAEGNRDPNVLSTSVVLPLVPHQTTSLIPCKRPFKPSRVRSI
ncbi:hypothetical protein PtB15_11B299 [Puccinia triticina]|nr:hypothetical protein PtB15_11B299 [Puccinia triticina]